MLNLSKELEKSSYYRDVLNDYKDSNRFVDLDTSIEDLVSEIFDGYGFTHPRRVLVPKPNGGVREVFMFNEKDSFILRVINKILMVKMGSELHPNAFSYKKGVRTYDAAKHLQSALREKDCYGVKLDIKSYFTSVDSDYLIDSLDGLIEDDLGKQLLVRLFKLNAYVENDELIEENLGIMPGSALSSFFANWILKDIDEEFSDRALVYARYSDDLIMFFDTKEKLYENVILMEKALAQRGLVINPDKFRWYDNPNLVDNFLGLNIYKNKIDISDECKKALRKLVKSICVKQRILFEKSSELKKDYSLKYVKKAILEINKRLYKSIFMSKEKRKSNRISYAFANLTCTDFLKEFDFYVLDCLRFVYSGNWNKGSVKYLSTQMLESLGFISSVKMFNLYRMGKDIYLNEVSLLGRTPNGRVEHCSVLHYHENVTYVEGEVSLYNVMDTLVKKGGCFLYQDSDTTFIRVPVSSIVFDIETKEVYMNVSIGFEVRKILMYRGKSFMLENLLVYMNDNIYDLGNYVIFDCDVHKNDLLMNSLTCCYKSPVPVNERLGLLVKDNNVDYNFNYFRMYDIREIVTMFLDLGLSFDKCSRLLRTDLPYSYRIALFNCLLYCFVLNNRDMAYGKRFIKLHIPNDNIKYSLILKRDWFN